MMIKKFKLNKKGSSLLFAYISLLIIAFIMAMFQYNALILFNYRNKLYQTADMAARTVAWEVYTTNKQYIISHGSLPNNWSNNDHLINKANKVFSSQGISGVNITIRPNGNSVKLECKKTFPYTDIKLTPSGFKKVKTTQTFDFFGYSRIKNISRKS
ncbi:hypothetical protein EXM63_06550 [Clostridium botulinum]|uniref:Uncharacterized protein n=1 Tax=Clostridium botulinum TaxID=1491 RepID=A0A6M0SXA2_CLOBO|nr:hypothetical protein [Clostridium botulinum]NFI74277.1 hypothetical protein [Clostridium sporogenes]NFP62185.1 hypothetical protein [Clostridium sporogenes]NFU95663.1 hypothetical protein [Clostridium sporogenes]NFV68687.1 hypothetical protein [Clostridium botulinum]